MLTFKQARRIAEAWIGVITDDQSAIVREGVRTLPYGWIFPWNSKEYLADTSKEENALVGNVPIFVDRVNGEVFVAGPVGLNWQERYEASIPPARLSMSPEQPDWSDE